jgi:hypothetical protein
LGIHRGKVNPNVFKKNGKPTADLVNKKEKPFNGEFAIYLGNF